MQPMWPSTVLEAHNNHYVSTHGPKYPYHGDQANGDNQSRGSENLLALTELAFKAKVDRLAVKGLVDCCCC